MDAFEIDQGVHYYQGLVENNGQTIISTKEVKTKHEASKLQAVLYNPVALVYNRFYYSAWNQETERDYGSQAPLQGAAIFLLSWPVSL